MENSYIYIAMIFIFYFHSIRLSTVKRRNKIYREMIVVAWFLFPHIAAVLFVKISDAASLSRVRCKSRHKMLFS